VGSEVFAAVNHDLRSVYWASDVATVMMVLLIGYFVKKLARKRKIVALIGVYGLNFELMIKKNAQSYTSNLRPILSYKSSDDQLRNIRINANLSDVI
jgi:hypothetical protein